MISRRGFLAALVAAPFVANPIARAVCPDDWYMTDEEVAEFMLAVLEDMKQSMARGYDDAVKHFVCYPGQYDGVAGYGPTHFGGLKIIEQDTLPVV